MQCEDAPLPELQPLDVACTLDRPLVTQEHFRGLTIVTSRTYTADLVALLLNLRRAANYAGGGEHEAPRGAERQTHR